MGSESEDVVEPSWL